MEWMSNRSFHLVPFTAMQKHFRRHGVIRRTMVIFPLVRPVYQEQHVIPMPILATSPPFLLASRSLLCDSLSKRSLWNCTAYSGHGQRHPEASQLNIVSSVHSIHTYTHLISLNLCPPLSPSDSFGSSALFLLPPPGYQPRTRPLPRPKKTVRKRMLLHHRPRRLPPRISHRKMPQATTAALREKLPRFLKVNRVPGEPSDWSS